VDNLYDNIPEGGYEGGAWMKRVQQQSATTDSNGLLDFQLAYPLAVGTTIYLIVYRTIESLAVSMVVQ
jgi:hypothetical protein